MKERPKLGDTRTAQELGLKGRALRVFAACPHCGIQRWVRMCSAMSLCRVCAVRLRPSCAKSTGHASTTWTNGVPQAGNTAIASEIGRKGRGHYTWCLCPDCGKGRWVQNRSHSQGSPCLSCANKRRLQGETNPRWNNGVRYDPGHGFYIRVKPDHPLYNMSMSAGGQRYIAEHRLVMAQHLGRPLERHEVVHHINGDNTDNRIENLELLPNRTNHLPYNLLQTQLYETQRRVAKLEAQVTQLQTQLMVAQLAGKLIPSEAAREILSGGTCRDLTGDTLLLLTTGEEKVHSSRKLGG